MPSATDFDFDVQTLTAAVSTMPFEPKQLASLGWFSADTVRSTIVKIERESENSFGVVAAVPRGAPGESSGRSSRDGKPFEIAHIPMHDVLWAEEVQDTRAFGTENTLTTFDVEMNKLLRRQKMRIGATLEHMRIGALKGHILNKDGTTSIVNFWEAFGLTQNTASCNLATGTGLRGTFDGFRDKIADELGDAEPTGYEAVIGQAAFRKLIDSKEVREEYLAQVKAGTAAGNRGAGDMLDYGGIIWRKAAQRASVHSSVARVEEDVAYIVPMGIPDFLIARFGPATWVETVNMPGVPVYSKAKLNHEETGWDVWSQSNPFFAPTRPRGILKATFTLS